MDIKQQFRNITAHFWVIPATLVVLAIVFAVSFTQIDRYVSDDILTYFPWLFTGTPDAARTILSVIAAAAITVVSISFSITIIAMQQAATQYTTRVLRTFTSDRGNQIVLGVYLATFVFSILVLRSVRTEEETISSFVPVLSVSFAIILSLFAMAVLVFFVNHISSSLQVTNILARIYQNMNSQIEDLYPEQLGEAADEPKTAKAIMEKIRKDSNSYSVVAKRPGFINQVNESELSKIDTNKAKWVYVRVKIGDFVTKGQPIVEIENYSPKSDDAKLADVLQESIVIGDDRSTTQDILFTFRQMVDIALKSLSPGINDQTSAIYSIHYLGEGLREISSREFPVSQRTFEGSSTKFVFARPEWETFLNLVFTQIRTVSDDKVFVMGSLIDVIGSLLESSHPNRRPPLLYHLKKLQEHIKKGDFIESDRKDLLKRLSQSMHQNR